MRKLKNEDTWCAMLWHLRCRIRFNLKSIQKVVAWEASHTIRNSDGNLYVRYLNWDGKQWNWNYNWLDNDFNGNNPAALLATHFISPLANLQRSFVLVLFCQAIHQAFFQVHSFFPKGLCIYYYQEILFPKEA
jgi:hypothetical protein